MAEEETPKIPITPKVFTIMKIKKSAPGQTKSKSTTRLKITLDLHKQHNRGNGGRTQKPLFATQEHSSWAFERMLDIQHPQENGDHEGFPKPLYMPQCGDSFKPFQNITSFLSQISNENQRRTFE
jgi:hypothetical protein